MAGQSDDNVRTRFAATWRAFYLLVHGHGEVIRVYVQDHADVILDLVDGRAARAGYVWHVTSCRRTLYRGRTPLEC